MKNDFFTITFVMLALSFRMIGAETTSIVHLKVQDTAEPLATYRMGCRRKRLLRLITLRDRIDEPENLCLGWRAVDWIQTIDFGRGFK